MAEGTSLPPTVININVQFNGRKIPISINSESIVKDLKSLLQPITNVLPRGQKLICKGKVLTDSMTLKALQVTNGSKVMLVAARGLHQGEGPIINDTKRIETTDPVTVYKPMTSRTAQWKITGVIALSECNLKVVPEEIWDCGLHTRVLDVSKNFIQEVPAKFGSLKCLNKLFLDANDISDERISWEGLSNLKSLTILSLNKNHLTTLPSTLGTLTSLKELHISSNKLTSIPDQLGLLKELQILTLNANRRKNCFHEKCQHSTRISSVPSSIGDCCCLVEINLSSNLLVELPETFGNLVNLKVLHLSNNGLTSLPSTLFKMCTQLSTVNLHRTEITNDILRQIDGWEAFDERRRLKHKKQLDFCVGSSGVFDEGADDDYRP
ncbi:plant intracellular Ras-group-related LRR protein 8 [Iris pallida]|uniref:Plant intracellular Ras-group-related LRR protein 8 n=1 Tax=Iris pallida TaxID=29817 RepID=A0AAX6FMR2_IRIPA|nr:plant intracellular Ras-group-related LRR protein 8 [Iris pallida]